VTGEGAFSVALTRDVTVVNELGLHARSAARLAGIAKAARGAVWVRRAAERADATSVMEVLTLACEKGSTLTLAIEDPQDAPVLDALVQLVENGFEE
jgi:phosphocarrier protein